MPKKKKKPSIYGVEFNVEFETVEELYEWANNDGAQMLEDYFQTLPPGTVIQIDF